MVNCNPETVSTDYDTSDRLYFEPLNEEEVLAILEREQAVGVVIRFGGQTPWVSRRAHRAGGLPHPRDPQRRDRPRRGPRAVRRCSAERGVRARSGGWPRSTDEALEVAGADRLPRARSSVVRARWSRDADLLRAGRRRRSPRAGVRTLVDRFLESAIEIDVDCLRRRHAHVAAVMEHVEEAAALRLVLCAAAARPARMSSRHRCGRSAARAGARRSGCSTCELGVVGGEVFVLEVNPRASRTVPFASEAIGVNLVEAACRIAAGRRSRTSACRAPRSRPTSGQGCGAALPPFPRRRPGARPGDALDGRGDGDGGGLADRVREGRARRRTPAAVGGNRVPLGARRRQGERGPVAAALEALGFRLVATRGTAARLPARASTCRSWRSDRRSSTWCGADAATSWSTRRRARAPAPTATRSARPRSSRGSLASRRSPAPPPCTRSRTRARDRQVASGTDR